MVVHLVEHLAFYLAFYLVARLADRWVVSRVLWWGEKSGFLSVEKLGFWKVVKWVVQSVAH